MKYRFHTLSAAIYIIDTATKTRERRAPNPRTPDHIIGMTESKGPLTTVPIVLIGTRASLRFGPNFYDTIYTTPVQRIELLEE